MSKELASIDHYDRLNKIVEEMLKGTKPRQIAKNMNLKLVEVEGYIQEWQGLARNNQHIQSRAREALSAADQHYDIIVNRMWETVEEAHQGSDLRVKASTLKSIADIEQKRIEMLQKSGLLDNQQLADQVLETERKQELLIKILRTVMNDYPEAAAYLRRELSKVTDQVESTVVQIEP